jgi:hypothetical protein
MGGYSCDPEELKEKYIHQISALEGRRKLFASQKKCYLQMYSLLESALGRIHASAKQLQGNMCSLYLRKRALRELGIDAQIGQISKALRSQKNLLGRIRQNYFSLQSKADSAATQVIGAYNRMKEAIGERDKCISRLEELGGGD